MIRLAAYLTGFSSRSDKSAGIRFATQELDGETFKQLQDLNGSFGFLLFKENPFNEQDIPTEIVEDKTKTPSKRLRAVLFLQAKQKGIAPEKFEDYYKVQMEKYIEHAKGKLD